MNIVLPTPVLKSPIYYRPPIRSSDSKRSTVHTAIWLYFWLLIFEGALRRWALPSLASPLLLVRDPVALFILGTAWSQKRFPVNGYVVGMLAISFLGTITAVVLGHGSLLVALFGARTLALHFPLMFVIGRYFTENDVLKMGHAVLWLTLPMAVLIAVQFYSPQSAWVNRGVGGDMAGAGFSGALGFFRPPATFSFITGTAAFFSMAACFIFYFWINKSTVNRFILICATVSLLTAIPLSISRTLFYQVSLTALFMVIAVSRKPKLLGRFLLAFVGITMLFILFSQTELFRTSTEAFLERFTSATEVEGGVKGTLVNRFLGGMIGAVNDSPDLPFWGRGIGMGTNVGAQLLSGDRMIFLISEGEWGRLIGELGLFLGLIAISIRLFLVLRITQASYKKLWVGSILPWLLLSFGFINILQGQWAQPTALGFSTLIGGLIFASLKFRKDKKNS